MNNRKPRPGLVHHSDCGVQYASEDKSRFCGSMVRPARHCPACQDIWASRLGAVDALPDENMCSLVFRECPVLSCEQDAAGSRIVKPAWPEIGQKHRCEGLSSGNKLLKIGRA